MSNRTVSFLWVGAVASIFVWILTTLVTPFEYNCAMAWGPSYVRQNNPVCRQSLQLVPSEIVDAGADAKWGNTASPAMYEYAGRCAWNKGTQCIMCYRDGGTGGGQWEDICADGDNPGGGSSLWMKALIGGDNIHPSPFDGGTDAQEVNALLGTILNPDEHKLTVLEEEKSTTNDAGLADLIENVATTNTSVTCSGEEPKFAVGDGFENGDFETGALAPWVASGSAPGSYAGPDDADSTIMGTDSGLTNVFPKAGTWSYRIGSQAVLLYRRRAGDSDTSSSISQLVDLTSATSIQYSMRLTVAGMWGNALTNKLWCTAHIDGVLVYARSPSSGTSNVNVTIDLSLTPQFQTGSHMFKVGCTHVASEWGRTVMGATSPTNGNKQRLGIDCTNPACGSCGAAPPAPALPVMYPNCLGIAGTCGVGVCSLNPPYAGSWCAENCAGTGTSALCPPSTPGPPGPNYVACAAIGGGCACPQLPNIVHDSFVVNYSTGFENSVNCEVTALRAQAQMAEADGGAPPTDGGPNHSGIMTATKSISTWDSTGKSYGTWQGSMNTAQTTVGAGLVWNLFGAIGNVIALAPKAEFGTSSVVSLANPLTARATVQRYVQQLNMLKIEAPTVEAAGALVEMRGIYIEDFSGAQKAPVNPDAGAPIATDLLNYAILSEHTGAHKIDGFFIVGSLAAAPTAVEMENGSIYYDTVLTSFQCREAGAWVACVDGAGIIPTSRGGMGADMTAAGAGELAVSLAGGVTWGTLAAGGADELISSGGAGDPVWESDLTFTTTTLRIDDHHITSEQTTAPTTDLTGTTLNDGGGAGAACAVTAGGTDTAGHVTITAGNGTPGAGLACLIVWDQAYATGPRSLQLTCADVDCADRQIYVTTRSTTQMGIAFAAALATDEVVELTWLVVE